MKGNYIACFYRVKDSTVCHVQIYCGRLVFRCCFLIEFIRFYPVCSCRNSTVILICRGVLPPMPNMAGCVLMVEKVNGVHEPSPTFESDGVVIIKRPTSDECR